MGSRIFGIFLLCFGIVLLVVGILLIVFGSMNAGANKVTVIVIGSIVIAFSSICMFFALRLMRKGTPIGAVPTMTDGRVGEYLAENIETFQIEGESYAVHYRKPVPGKNGRPSDLTIHVEAQTPTTVHFKQETGYDRLGKRLGIAKEYQTGDEDFDESIYIRCPSSNYLEKFLDDPVRRIAILTLKKLGFTEVRFTGDKLEAYWVGFDPAKHHQDDLQARVGQILIRLRGDLPEVDHELVQKEVSYNKRSAMPLWLFQIVYAILIVFVFIYPPVRVLSLFGRGAIVLAVLYMVFGWLGAMLLRGTSISHDRWFLLMGIGLILHPMGSLGLVSAVNALGDSSPIVTHNCIIVDKHFSTGKNNKKNYKVTVTAWDDPTDTFDFGVNASEYNNAVKGVSVIQVSVGSGSLDYEWIKAKRIVIQP